MEALITESQESKIDARMILVLSIISIAIIRNLLRKFSAFTSSGCGGSLCIRMGIREMVVMI